jgi:hypothetical protein
VLIVPMMLSGGLEFKYDKNPGFHGKFAEFE